MCALVTDDSWDAETRAAYEGLLILMVGNPVTPASERLMETYAEQGLTGVTEVRMCVCVRACRL